MSGFSLFGVNLSGAEYNPNGTRGLGYDYIYPTHAEIDYFASKGMTAIRLPFALERVQPVANGPLSSSQLGYIDDIVNYAGSKGIDVILDPHDFGTEYGTTIGSTAASNATFANFWGQLAGHFASTSNVLFGLMNEPDAVTPAQWIVSVNAAIAAIRAAGATSQQILVPGTDWDSALSWVSSGNASIVGGGVVDPSHNFAFEVHQYLDSDASGTHSSVVSTSIGVERLSAVTAWAEATGNKLFLGEFGVGSDPTSLAALNNMLGYMAAHTDAWEGGTYWAAGAWWGPYLYSVEPANGVDKPQMAVLDRYVATTIATNGSTSLTEFAGQYYLNNAASLRYAGAAVTPGEFGNAAPIGAEQTASGYAVAWKVTGADQYMVWNTDSSGNYVSSAFTHAVSGASAALEAYETAFHLDLNGDGVIGVPTTVIATDGSTSLTEVADNYDLYDSGVGPSLKFAGAAVVAGQFGDAAPIGAEATASGYVVAWKVTGADHYMVWIADSSGNYVSSAFTSAVSGTSAALEAYETVFHQDLNGDGVIGIPTTVIETDGPNSLTEVGNNYDLTSGGTGPSLNFAGAPVVAGEFGNAAPIAMEPTASGYLVAWKVTGADHYMVWNTDSSGNYISSAFTGAVSGSSAALESYEAVFHHDLNGDGHVGVVVAAGATLDVPSAAAGIVTFAGSTGTLKLDLPSAFSGSIAGFTGDGTLSGSDHIDLVNLAFNNLVAADSTYSTSTHLLQVSNGTSTDVVQFIGTYAAANFKFATDGHGGTIVYDPPAPPNGADHRNDAVTPAAATGQDNFVFAANFGQATVAGFKPATDTIQFDHAMFASINALLAAIHDDANGNAVITDAAHDTLTLQNITTAQLIAHQGDFHLT